MKPKVVVGVVVIIAGVILSAVNFIESNVEYGDFATAERTQRKIQVKGEWVKEQGSKFDSDNVQFTFVMKDEQGREMKVVLDGAMPNNFDLATSVVAKGKIDGDHFHATEVLTKCPSKYEGDAETVKKTL